jgi:hypothetical protein
MGTYNALKYNVSFANAGSLVLLTTNTASSSASISFTSGIDSTYDEYLFIFNNIHPASDNVEFYFNMSTDSGSTYNVTKTTSGFSAYHDEAGSSAALAYDASGDLAQGTGYLQLNQNGTLGNDNDQSLSGSLHLFSPSDTTFVKHFVSTVQYYETTDYSINSFVAGYGNTTSAVDAIDFKMSSGNIDSGTIQMFGVVK